MFTKYVFKDCELLLQECPVYRRVVVVPDLQCVELELVSRLVRCILIFLTDMHSVFEYTYLLFWNSIFTVAPVIGLGLFDRIIGKVGFWQGMIPH